MISSIALGIIISFSFILYAYGEPILNDLDYISEVYVNDLNRPTTMVFIENEILVLQKNDGKVMHIKEGKLLEEPVLDVNVFNMGEQGLLGIINVNSTVYLYYTESNEDGGQEIANRIYQFRWNGQKLVEPVLINEFPPTEGWNQHVGGVMTVDKEGVVYALVGDMKAPKRGLAGPTQNYDKGELRDFGIIVKVGLDNSTIKPSESSNPLENYFAIGIRNGFGIAIDHVTGFLWDTENGHTDYDEINLVLKNFNSGWEKIQGPGNDEQISSLPKIGNFTYSDPEFTWQKPVAVTGLTFVDSPKFEKYKDYLFVSDCINGNLYSFKLNSERTGFEFESEELMDMVHNSGESMDEILFGTGFGCVTDVKFGPDGFFYVLSHTDGSIYRIKPLLDAEKSDMLEEKYELKPYSNLANVNLSSRDLSNIDLSFAILTNADLRFANLTDVVLIGANLSNAYLSNAVFSNVDFSKADLSGTDLRSSIFEGVNFKKAKITDSNAQAAFFGNANFNEADLSNSNLRAANLSHAKLVGTNLENVSLVSAELDMANLTDANLKNADLRYAKLRNADLSGANMVGADLTEADFTGSITSKTTQKDRCYGEGWWDQLLRRALNKIQDVDFILLKPIEWMIPHFCFN